MTSTPRSVSSQSRATETRPRKSAPLSENSKVSQNFEANACFRRFSRVLACVLCWLQKASLRLLSFSANHGAWRVLWSTPLLCETGGWLTWLLLPLSVLVKCVLSYPLESPELSVSSRFCSSLEEIFILTARSPCNRGQMPPTFYVGAIKRHVTPLPHKCHPRFRNNISFSAGRKRVDRG